MVPLCSFQIWAVKGIVWNSVDGLTWNRVSAETPFGARGYGYVLARPHLLYAETDCP